MTPEEFVLASTHLAPVPHVPEIALRMAADPYDLWEETGREPPPFWAYPWAGGQGLARYILDHPQVVAGRSVLDVASGSGLVALAAAKAGARRVVATDIDPCALAAIALNASANGTSVEIRALDLTRFDGAAVGSQVVLAADIFYDRHVAVHAVEFLRRAQTSGAHVLVSDPGRAFLPHDVLTEVERHAIPVIRDLEETERKDVTVYQLAERYPHAVRHRLELSIQHCGNVPRTR